MGIVDTNPTQAVVTPDTDQSTAQYQSLVMRDITRFGNQHSRETPSVISRTRLPLRSKNVGLTSGFGLDMYLGIDMLDTFLGALYLATPRNRPAMFIRPTAASATTDAYTVPALTQAQVDLLETDSLLWVSGFINDANNGLKTIQSQPSVGDTDIDVNESLANETNVDSANLSLAGVRISASTNTTATYSSLTNQLTLTGISNPLGDDRLHEGMFVNIGSIPDEDGDIQNAYTNVSTNDMHGKARILSLTSTTIVLDHLADTLKFTDSTSPTTAVDIIFGMFVTNEPTDSARFKRTELTLEVRWEDFLDKPGQMPAVVPGYEYAEANLVNNLTLNIPLRTYATINVETIGTRTQEAVETRRANADTARSILLQDTYRTGGDLALAELAVDSQALKLTYFSASIAYSNNVEEQDALSYESTFRITPGDATTAVTLEVSKSDIMFDSVVNANTPTSLTSMFVNSDGVIISHVPSLTLSQDSLTLGRNQAVRINSTADAFEDALFKTGSSFSVWAVPFTRDDLGV